MEATRIALASVATILLAATPATGHGSDRPIHDEPDASALRVMHEFAECTIRRRRGATQRFLRAEPGSAEAGRLMMRAITHECLRGADMLSLSGPLARGMLFEAVYRRDFRDPPSSAIVAAPALAYPQAEAVSNSGSFSLTALFRLGECVVRAAPAEAHVLLHTAPTGEEEAAAFEALRPRFSACIPAGERIEFSAPILRGALAEALYRLRSPSPAR